MEIFHFIARKSKVNIYSDMEARERCQALTEYDPLVSTVPEAHLHFCLPTIWFFTFLVFLYSTNSRFFFLMLPQTGFYPLKKKNANFYIFQKILFSDFFFFQIPPHYLWEGRKALCACRGMCNENFKDAHAHFQVKRI